MKRLLTVLVTILLTMTIINPIFADSGNVAKVGSTEYATIDEAIAAWTNNTTLTLLDNVTLTDVIKLSSTEYHVLDLGTYTMTAASGKNAIEIINNGRTSASYTLDIKADATNPGGITATGKAIVKTTGKSGVKDRPIIRFYNGIFNATNIVSHSGSNGTNCPQFQFHAGIYNGNISTNRTLNIFYGGTFNGRLMMSVDSSAYTRIQGGTFKYLSNLYMSALNNEKFAIGTAKGVFDVGIYVDENGYYVVGGSIIKDAGSGTFAASAQKSYGTNEYFRYSSLAYDDPSDPNDPYGLFYESLEVALKKEKDITIYEDGFEIPANSGYTGKIRIPEDKTKLSIKENGNSLNVQDVAAKLVTNDLSTYYKNLSDALNDAADGDTIILLKDISAPLSLAKAIKLDTNAYNVGQIVIENTGATVKGIAGLDVSVNNSNYIVVYENGEYSAKEVIATVNGIGYTTLDEAMAAANEGDEVILEKDLDEDVDLDKPIVLNTNGKGLRSIRMSHLNSVVVDDGDTDVELNVDDAELVFENGRYTIKPKVKISCAGEKDLNCDGVVTCDEGVGPGWDWNEEKGVCEFKGLPSTGEFIVVNTAVK